MQTASFLRLAGYFALIHLLASPTARAGSASWNLNPTTGDWNSAANWTPNTVPNGGDETATFGLSNETSPFVSANTQIGAIVFQTQAPAYSIDVNPGVLFSMGGAGVENNSSAVQTLRPVPGPFGTLPGLLRFVRQASAGTSVIDTLGGLVDFDLGAETIFSDHSTAGSATLLAEGAKASAAYSGGLLFFENHSTAATAMVITSGGGGTGFTIGGITVFTGSSSAGNATVITGGGTEIGAFGGQTQFSGKSTAGAATLTATGGDVGYAGTINFFQASSGGTTSVELLDQAYIDISNHDAPGMTIGSLQGSGAVFLGALNLAIGSNAKSTVYTGSLRDGGSGGTQGPGSVTKIGPGRLSLDGASTYSGGTVVARGTLRLDNRRDSATGTGPLQVNAGTLGGVGSMAGNVTVGTGTGAGASLEPSVGSRESDTLTIKGTLAFEADATYLCKLNTVNGTVDSVVANGVTIGNGAQFSLQSVADQELTAGAIFIVISNTATTSISGTFANLSDGAILSVNGNSFQASYEGGDGNDLTLTVVP